MPAGEQGADYRTWYRKGCGAGAAGGTGVRHMQEMQKLGMRRFGVAWHVRRSELGAASGVESDTEVFLKLFDFSEFLDLATLAVLRHLLKDGFLEISSLLLL